jgi:hypothetical protein
MRVDQFLTRALSLFKLIVTPPDKRVRVEQLAPREIVTGTETGIATETGREEAAVVIVMGGGDGIMIEIGEVEAIARRRDTLLLSLPP